MILRIALSLICICIFSGTCFTQYQPVKNISVKNGLPSGIVYDCVQDREGFMWFATEAGLAKYDGQNFTVFTREDGLSNNVILRIALDKDGSLWIFPFGTSPCIYDFVKKKILNENNYPELKKLHDETLSVYLLKANGGLFATTNKHFLFLENKKITFLTLEKESSRVLYSDSTNLIILPFHRPETNSHMVNLWKKKGAEWQFQGKAHLKENHVLHSNYNGLGKNDTELTWDDKKILSTSINSFNLLQLKTRDAFEITKCTKITTGAEILSIAENRGKIFVCTTSGIEIFDTSGKLTRKGLAGTSISRCYVDKAGNEWYCSIKGDGVFLSLKTEVENMDKRMGLPDENITAITLLPSGKLLAGDIEGNIYSLNPNANTPNPFLIARFNTPLREIKSDTGFMFGISNREAFLLADNRMIKRDEFNHAFKSVIFLNNHFYFGEYSGIRKFTKNLIEKGYFLSGRRMSALCTFQENIFFGNNSGLFVVNVNDMEQNPDSPAVRTLLNEPVISLHFSEDSILWVGTSTQGVFAFVDQKRISSINILKPDLQRKGYICKRIFSEKGKNRVWVATNRGIHRITYQKHNNTLEYHTEVFTLESGLLDNDINDVFATSGKVYAASAKGISIFPDSMQKINIPLFITGVRINQKGSADSTLPVQPLYHLNYNQNSLTIQFAGICFSCEDHIRYEYRLLGGTSDSIWIATKSTTVEIGELAPGSYTFQVRTDYSATAAIQLIIKPPYWKTNWFYAAVLLLLSLLVYLIIKIYTVRIRKKNLRQIQLNKKFAELELNALQSQMNPHFIFNAMNTLQSYIFGNDTLVANQYLSKFAELLRLFLNASRSKHTTISSEVRLLELYIEMENLRHEKSFKWAIELDSNLNKETEIPSVIIQPFVENAIAHGLRYRKDGQGELLISFAASEGSVICKVDDNGIGRDASNKINEHKNQFYKSYGQSLINDKITALKHIQNIDIKISHIDKKMSDGSSAGTLVIIEFKNVN